MYLEHPINSEVFKRKREEILANFSKLDSSTRHILSLENYISSYPEKFFSSEAFDVYYNFLMRLKVDNPVQLSEILIERETGLSQAVKILDEINKKDFHNVSLPKDYNLILFIDKYIHFDILKLWESPFYEFLYVVALVSRENRGKGVDGLDLYNVSEELDKLDSKFGDFKQYQSLYNKVIRNSIGHGKVEFLDGRILYKDKREEYDINTDKIIELFDDLVDVLNGFCLALRLFYLSNSDFCKSYEVNVPNSILLNELMKAGCVLSWDIKACLDSTVNSKKRLNIFIETTLTEATILRMNIFYTGILAGELTQNYSEIALHMNNNGKSGLAMFDAEKLRTINKENSDFALENYREAYLLDMELLYFANFKQNKLFKKIATFWHIGKSISSLFILKPKRLFNIIKTNIHSKKWYSVVEGSISINDENIEDIDNFILDNYKFLVKSVVNEAKRNCGYLTILKYLPAKFITVTVFKSDIRRREWRLSKLVDKKVCFIQMNSMWTIKIPDYYKEKVKRFGNYKIIWPIEDTRIFNDE